MEPRTRDAHCTRQPHYPNDHMHILSSLSGRVERGWTRLSPLLSPQHGREDVQGVLWMIRAVFVSGRTKGPLAWTAWLGQGRLDSTLATFSGT